MMPTDKNSAADTSELVALLERRLAVERAERRRLQALLKQSAAGVHTGDGAQAVTVNLERLIEERTKALSLARDEAIAASESKSSFLANMSHEIRTPLTSIIGFAELLQDPSVAKDEKAGAATTIVRNGRHLLEVINDILDMSKIESRQLVLERIEVGLPRLLSDIEALASSRAQEKGLLFTIEHHLPLPPVMLTDPVRLKQILLNFCSNAIKFSEEGEVRLAVHFDAAGCRLRFSVIDTGIGMTEPEMQRLFKPFVQADVSTTRKFGGTGLGLYISRQLADMLGGQIRVSSQPGKGSRFALTIPLGTEPRPQEMLTGLADFDDFTRQSFQITAIDLPTLSGRVLVAEDGPDNQRLLSSYLRHAGVEFDMVGDGQRALELAGQREYALVLMDIQMPVMDGVSATRLLRERRYAGPIVALTANVMQDDVNLYKRIGCNDVLAKPIDRARFHAVLKRYVEGALPASSAPSSMLSSGSSSTPSPSPARTAEEAYDIEFAALREEFVKGLPEVSRILGRAAAASDLEQLRLQLHTLKGTAGSYGFDGLTALAGSAEASLARRDSEGLRESLARLREAFAGVAGAA